MKKKKQNEITNNANSFVYLENINEMTTRELPNKIDTNIINFQIRRYKCI